MSDQTEKPNWFVRGCIIVFLVFLGVLTAYSFRFGPVPFGITAGILSVLGLMVVALLAESFNSISFGSLLRLRKDITKAETEKKEAKEEVRELRSSLLTLATTFHQSQVTNNISGLDVATLKKVLGVVEATPEEIEEAKEESTPAKPALVEPEAEEDEEESFEFRRALRKILQDDLIKRFAEKYKLPLLELRRDVKFESGLENPDPIMSRTLIYHGYVKTEQKEYFIEIGPTPLGGGFILNQDERLYVRLAKILFYKQIKKVEAEMVYLEAVLPESATKRSSRRTIPGKVAETFQPAISNNLLRVETLEVTEQEFSVLKEKVKKKT